MNKLFIFTCILFILSCGKDECFTYKGRILAFGTKEPVADALVNIIAGKQALPLDPQVEWLIDSVRTDKEGRFEIEVKGGDYHRIGAVIKEGFFPDLGNQETYLFEDGNLANRDYIIDPMGTLHVKIENDPNNSGEFIRINLPTQGYYKTTFSKIEEIYRVRAGRFHKYYFNIDIEPSRIDSVFCPAFKTTDLIIKF